MVRLPRALFTLAAALGLPGCLLFTDPINEAPVLTITGPVQASVGIPADFTVVVRDDRSPAPLQVAWADIDKVNEGCDGVTATSWNQLDSDRISSLSADVPFSFVAKSIGIHCVCARATDDEGASGQDCQRVVVDSPPPVAVITDPSGAPVATAQPKCSQIRLSAEQSTVTAGDSVQLAWTLEYAGADSKGGQARLGDCQGLVGSRPDVYRCFYAAVPGVYKVTLTVTDTAAGGAPQTATAQVAITVAADRPACMVQSAPELTAKWIMLARNPGLGAAYESRTFSVSRVDDDCEPFPARTDTPTTQQAAFIWSVMDGTQGKSTWDVQSNPTNANAFTVDQDNFPNARPGDTIGLRVEVRDTPGQLRYAVSGPICADVSTPICCGPAGCQGVGDCVYWTTWTVQFEP